MNSKPLPTPDELRQLLRYDPEAGKLYWLTISPEWFQPTPARSREGLASHWNAKYSGKEAFTSPKGNGYRRGGFRGRDLLAHRVIWAMVHGEWPLEIDHINGDRADNRISNLRAADREHNGRNVPPHRDNRSGLKGAFWHKAMKKWCASIMVAGKHHRLGFFPTAEEAHAAYCEASIRLHGSFGRTS